MCDSLQLYFKSATQLNKQLMSRVAPKLTWKKANVKVTYDGVAHSFILRYRDLGEYALAEYANKVRGKGFVLHGDATQPDEPWGSKVFLEEEAAVRERLRNPEARIAAVQLYIDATQVRRSGEKGSHMQLITPLTLYNYP